MDKDAQEYLKRAAECARLADAESDPELKAYLIKLTSSWMQVAMAEVEERYLEARSKGSRQREYSSG